MGEDAHIVGMIPARWGSTRFPGKPLHPIAGKPLVQHVWDRCQECSLLDAVAICTDDDRIAEACRDFGAKVAMTSGEHPSGTDRIAEALGDFSSATHVINVQGDEPLISPALIDALAEKLRDDPALEMVTAANEITDDTEIADPNVVKVVTDVAGRALYFSRSQIPYPRNALSRPALRHKGIYGFTVDCVRKFTSWEPTALEQAESLEQLRALEHGVGIQVVITDDRSGGVDTLEQVGAVEAELGG